jgi:hypothetical protein
VLAERGELALHEQARLDLLGAGRPVAVPEEDELLGQLVTGGHHPVQPPGAQAQQLAPHVLLGLLAGVAAGVLVDRRVRIGTQVRFRGGRRPGVGPGRGQQRGERGIETRLLRRVNLDRGGSEARASQQVGHERSVSHARQAIAAM